MASYNLALASDGVEYSSVAVGEDCDRQSVVPREVEHGVRLSLADEPNKPIRLGVFFDTEFLIVRAPSVHAGIEGVGDLSVCHQSPASACVALPGANRHTALSACLSEPIYQ